MPKIQGYKQVYLNEMMEMLDDGENRAKEILSSFSCPLNPDVEDFLRHKAIDFARQGIAQTVLVFASHKQELALLGYYTLANKVIFVPKKAVSRTMGKRVAKFGVYNDDRRGYTIAAPLIAQLGKNFTDGLNKVMHGDELLNMACNKIMETQLVLGGRFTYVECEDKPQLIEFYTRNGFCDFAKRTLDKDETDTLSGSYLVQLLKYIHHK